jgi:nucleoside-diphosphate-sugar epimerase
MTAPPLDGISGEENTLIGQFEASRLAQMSGHDSGRPVAAVTGASGYLGSLVAEGLASEGFAIRRLVRNPEPDSGDRFFELRVGCDASALEDVDVLVHCAYDMTATSRTDIWETNVYGTRSLLDLAESHNVRRSIVVSSMSAFAGTRQIYGKAKLASEIDAFARNGCVVRPGLVYGPRRGGMAGTLRKLSSLPVVPLIGRGSFQFTVHEDDVREAFVRLVRADSIPLRPIGLAHPKPVPFEPLLRAFAQADGKTNLRYVPLPWQLVYWSARAAEFASLRLPVRADSVLGLVRPAPCVPNPSDLKHLGINLRPFEIVE